MRHLVRHLVRHRGPQARLDKGLLCNHMVHRELLGLRGLQLIRRQAGRLCKWGHQQQDHQRGEVQHRVRSLRHSSILWQGLGPLQCL